VPFRIAFSCLVVFSSTAIRAESPNLAFQPAGEGYYEFDTGVLKGQLKLDGKYQGLYPLVHVPSGTQLVHPPGVFSFYRALTTNHRYGNAARDWPTTTKRLPDGAVEVRWAAAEEHPLEMTAVYRWTAADTLDLEATVSPQQDMAQFELFMSSYFTKTFRASVYTNAEAGSQLGLGFTSIDKKPGAKGGYVMFPRDQEATEIIRDGRWTIPPSPVDWAIGRRFAAPLAMRRDTALGLTALMMCLPDDCFAVASPWNPASPDSGGYRSLYLSLFGQDVKAAQTVRARCRLIIQKNLADEQAVRYYDNFVKACRDSAAKDSR
jgi:hypothetical protein